MAKKRICKNCKYVLTDESIDVCPNCSAKGKWNENYQGRVYVFDPESSVIGKKIGAKVKGEYAIRSRS